MPNFNRWMLGFTLSILISLSTYVYAAEPKDPLAYPIITYLFVLVVASIGGVVSINKKIQDGEKYSVMEFMGEVFTSAFAGLLTFWACEASGIPMIWSSILIGLMGHMGIKGVYLLEKLWKKKLGIEEDLTDASK